MVKYVDRLLQKWCNFNANLSVLSPVQWYVALGSWELMQPGGCLSIKMASYQYRDPHVKDKTVLRPSYL